MKLDELKTRLEELAVFDRVEAAISISEINKQSVRKPIAFIAPAGTTTEQSERNMGPALQRLNETYSVIYCIPSQNDKTGFKANETLQEIISTTRKSLISFAPINAQKMTFDGGELMLIEGGFILWHDQFSTQYYIEGNQ